MQDIVIVIDRSLFPFQPVLEEAIWSVFSEPTIVWKEITPENVNLLVEQYSPLLVILDKRQEELKSLTTPYGVIFIVFSDLMEKFFEGKLKHYIDGTLRSLRKRSNRGGTE